jgi:antitoxin component of RelBE/YafQ-DinJ toxin-antitoxin module
MASTGRPTRNIRVDNETWDAFKLACDDIGLSRTDALVAFMKWMTGQTNKLPQRPNR